MKPNRHRPSPALVVAMLALIVALTGTSYAAITITGRQVKDGTITSADIRNRSLQAIDFKPGQLHAGAPGPKGDTGDSGAPGTAGAPGDPGAPGTLADTLPSGRTLHGTYFIAGTATAAGQPFSDSISFPARVSPTPIPHYVPAGQTNPSCPGTANDPQADPGHLCVYGFDVAPIFISIPVAPNATSVAGTGLLAHADAAGEVQFQGTWAVTAS